jgi:hypothetical protein
MGCVVNGRRYVEYSDGVTLTVGHETIELSYVTDGGWRVRQRYSGYTRRQCVAMFRDYLETLDTSSILP